MPKSRHLNRLVTALIVFAACLSAGCQRDGNGTHDPNGPYAKRNDGGGKRLLVIDDQGNRLGKLRVGRSRTRVYDADMRFVGVIRETDDTILAEIPGQKDPETLAIAWDGKATEMAGRFRIEPVENGWAVFSPSALTVGYISVEGDVWHFRDDYSSSSTRIAKVGERSIQNPEGDYQLTRSDVPPPVSLTMTIVELDPIARAILGRWLVHREPEHAAK